jgi:hypothetical protein
MGANVQVVEAQTESPRSCRGVMPAIVAKISVLYIVKENIFDSATRLEKGTCTGF